MPSSRTAEEVDAHHKLTHGFCIHGELRGDCEIFNGRMNTLGFRIYLNACAHGFHEEDRNFGEQCALIHSEVSEALECHRKGEEIIHYGPDGKPLGLGAEFVQVIVRTLETLHTHGVDIDKVMSEVMKYDEGRPYRHGKRY